MGFEFGLGIGFALGFVAGMQLSRVIWPEYKESVWDRHQRERNIVKEALDKREREESVN